MQNIYNQRIAPEEYTLEISSIKKSPSCCFIHSRDTMCSSFAQPSPSMRKKRDVSPHSASILPNLMIGLSPHWLFLVLRASDKPDKALTTNKYQRFSSTRLDPESLQNEPPELRGNPRLKLLTLPESTLCLCFQCIFFPGRKTQTSSKEINRGMYGIP